MNKGEQKYVDTITSCHDIIAYLMILMNHFVKRIDETKQVFTELQNIILILNLLIIYQIMQKSL